MPCLIFLRLWVLGLAPAYGQERKPPENPWTGKLADGRVITRADLDQILKDHKLWVESDKKEGNRVDLFMPDLSRADLSRANLIGARFEPKPGSLPEVSGLLYLKGLDSLKFWGRFSHGLMELREIFKKAGMRDEERQVTYALNHNRRVNAWKEIKEETEIGWFTREIARFGNIFQLVFFE